MAVGYLGDSGNIAYQHHRVGGCFHKDSSGIRPQGVLHQLQISGINIFKLYIVFGKELAQPQGASVEILCKENVVPRVEKLKDSINGGHTTGKSPSSLSLLQLADGFLQIVSGRVAAAAVIIAGALLEAGMAEGGGHINRLSNGAGII